MPSTQNRPRVPNAPETIQRGLVLGFTQAAMAKRGGAPRPRYTSRRRFGPRRAVAMHRSRSAAAC
jgi:hypothetical protein